jgi:hypothetical protein
MYNDDQLDSEETEKQEKDDYIQNFMHSVQMDEEDQDTCGRLWCQHRDECLWKTLLKLQNDVNVVFFDENLDEKDFIISQSDFNKFKKTGCCLAESWYEEGSLENELIVFALDIFQTLLFYSDLDLKNEEKIEAKEFAKNIYLFLSKHLNKYLWREKEDIFDKIEKFLISNDVFNEEDKIDFLRDFRLLRNRAN